MEQEVKHIKLKDLVLWTENPRDPIDINAVDQDIVDRAFGDHYSKWSLLKLAKEMGEYYDFSELPTVVFHGEKPVVYDGNRRVILGKIKTGIITVPNNTKLNLPNFPDKIPCNVCSEKTALNNILRKHGDSGSWEPLERDIFLHKFMGEPKSLFLILEEETSIISENPHLNQRFVKEEIFKEDVLNSIGFTLQKGKLNSIHSDEDAFKLLSDISKKIEVKEISTRKNRGKMVEILDPSSQRIIDQNKKNQLRKTNVNFGKNNGNNLNHPFKLSPRTRKSTSELFGGKLYLRMGEVSNIYRDIDDLYKFYNSKKNSLSNTFPNLIRMSLRLLCEAAAKEDRNKKIDTYLKGHFETAKKNLDKDIKTTLSNHNVNENSIIQLLHSGAHNYQSSNNIDKTIAMSIIIGSILTISHGKEN